MRLRNIPGARETIGAHPLVIHDIKEWKGRFRELFGNDNPIHIEIGMGKGKFIMALAQSNPKINYIGIEKYSSVLLRGLEKREEAEPLHNLYYIRMDAEEICDVFGQEEVERIYLNFSDPWPKDRHAKRRLTSRQYFDRYDKILKKDGVVIFKTDNRELFDFSLQEVKEAQWKLVDCTFDLHSSQYAEGNVMTEYEEKFVKEGKPINRFTACR